jgi:disease resistance protein RPS2
VIGVEECDEIEETTGTDEEGRTHQRIVSCFDTTLRVLVLKKLPNLNSIYSGRLLCNSLEEITVGDCPQLTRIPI